MPIERELIEGLIDDIRLRLAELRSQEVREGKLKDMFFRWGVEHGLQTLLEACLDIARHIVSARAWGIQAVSRDYFILLGEKKVLGQNLADKLSEAMSVRNRLVHEYGQISRETLAKFVNEDLGDIDEYIKQISEYLTSS